MAEVGASVPKLGEGSVYHDSRQNALPTYLPPGRAAKRKKMKIAGTYLLQSPFGRNKTNLPTYLASGRGQSVATDPLSG